MTKQATSFRLSALTTGQIADLTRQTGLNQAEVVAIAIDRMYQQEARPMTTFETLQEITGHEAGAVVYHTGDVWVGNWTQIAGIPREFVAGSIGLGETLTATPCQVPSEAIHAMRQHITAQGDEPVDESVYSYSAWEVTAGNETVTVVVSQGWN